jgi:uncharacterized LabA/DUF88 family protein
MLTAYILLIVKNSSLSALRTAESTPAGAEKPPSQRRRGRPNRCGANVTLHLVDIDNLLGDPRTTDRASIERVYEHYRWVADYRPGDHVVVATGCNGLHVLEVELAWPGVSHRRKRGQDGADHVLCAEAEWAAASGAYDRVVIASGDREFMVAFQTLLSAGVDVQVVASHRRLAVGLAALAHGRLRYFGTPGSAETVLTAA